MVGEGLVVGHDVEELIDRVSGLWNVNADAHWLDHVPHGTARIAVVRGLLLDLLATGDIAGVDAGMEAYITAREPLAKTNPGSDRTAPTPVPSRDLQVLAELCSTSNGQGQP